LANLHEIFTKTVKANYKLNINSNLKKQCLEFFKIENLTFFVAKNRVWVDQISRKVTSKTYSFYGILLKITSNATRRNEHLMLIEEVKKAYAEKKKKDRRQTYLFKQYAILNVDGEEKLINKNESGQIKPRIYANIESLYNDMQREHLITGHAGRDKFYKQCMLSYQNITIEAVVAFGKTCSECIVRTRKNTISSLVVKPIRSSYLLSEQVGKSI
jgi:hypothetical protein